MSWKCKLIKNVIIANKARNVNGLGKKKDSFSLSTLSLFYFILWRVPKIKETSTKTTSNILIINLCKLQ